MNNFDASILFTLKEEDGFSDDPHDPGGATMRGITLEEYRSYFNRPKATVADLKRITDAELDEIYYRKYWGGVRAEELPAGVDLSVFDMGVNAGPTRSIKILQLELGFEGGAVDGILGPQTMRVTLRQDPATLIGWLHTGHQRFYRSLSTFKYFGRGWLSRADRREMAALGLMPPAAVAMGKAEV